MDKRAVTNVIKRIMRPVNMTDEYLQILLSNLAYYELALTTKERDPARNLEMFEQLGDVTINKCMKWYFFRRFPQINCPGGVGTLARLAINHQSRQSLASIAEDYDFWPIVLSFDKANATAESREKIMEDVFEAFVGVTEFLLDKHVVVGAGYSVIYSMIEAIMDLKDISLAYEDLYDGKSRMNELANAIINKQYGKIVYDVVRDADGYNRQRVSLIPHRGGRACREVLAQLTVRQMNEIATDVDREKAAAEIALRVLSARGISLRRDEMPICPP